MSSALPRARASRLRALLSPAFAAVLIAAALTLTGGYAAPASAATMTAVNQCNGTDNVGGESVKCTVTVTNRLDVATDVSSATIEVVECHGAANTTPTCTTTITESDAAVTTVSQCNGSGNGGGATVECHVDVENIVTGTAASTPATVNQCIVAGEGGGTQPTAVCDPTGSTTNATVTQCNEAGNGGGGTVRVQCEVGPSVVTALLPVRVDQCIGSGNGGGATVICSTNLRLTVLPAESGPIATPVPTPAPTPAPTGTPTPAAVPPVASPPSSPDAKLVPTAATRTLAETGPDLSVLPLAAAGTLLGLLLYIAAARRRKAKLAR